MKVVFFCNNLFGYEGWSKYSLDLIKELKTLGIEPVCIVQSINEDVAVEQIELLRRPLLYYKYPLLVFADIFRIRKYIQRIKPDLIHYLIEPYGLFAPQLKEHPSCLTIHGTYAIWPLNRGKILAHLARTYYSCIGRILSVSNYTKYKLLEKIPELGPKIQVIHNTPLLIYP